MDDAAVEGLMISKIRSLLTKAPAVKKDEGAKEAAAAGGDTAVASAAPAGTSTQGRPNVQLVKPAADQKKAPVSLMFQIYK